jgi:CHASE2 domain-containing sensor protein
MSVQDSRLKRTAQTLWIATFSYRLGSMEAHTGHTTKYWVLMAVYLIGLVCSLYVLLRGVWKPNAAAV